VNVHGLSAQYLSPFPPMEPFYFVPRLHHTTRCRLLRQKWRFSWALAEAFCFGCLGSPSQSSFSLRCSGITRNSRTHLPNRTAFNLACDWVFSFVIESRSPSSCPRLSRPSTSFLPSFKQGRRGWPGQARPRLCGSGST